MQRSPDYVSLTLGCVSFSAGVAWTVIGKAWVRFNGWIYRAEKPNEYWWNVATYYLVGVGFIGYFLYKVYELSN